MREESFATGAVILSRLLKKVIARAKCDPQGLKPESIFSDLAARVELLHPIAPKPGAMGTPVVPFPFPAFFEFFRSLLRGGFTGRNLDASGIVPIGVCRGGNETHRALGEGGDGQTGVDAKISCHYRSIADVHVFVAEDAMARVDYSVSGGIGDYATSDAVGSPGNVEQDFRKHTHGESPSKMRKLLGKLIGLRNVGGDLLAPADQELAKRPEPGALPAHLDLAIERLHTK